MIRFVFCALLALPLVACDAFMLNGGENGKEPASGKILLSLEKSTAITKADASVLYGHGSDKLAGGFPALYSGLWDNITIGNISIMLDTNKFLLSIYNTEGGKIFSGKYSEKPDEIMVAPGSYDIKFHSASFTSPGFDKPLFGDEQTVIVEENGTTNVVLTCRQLNGGVRLLFSTQFMERFQNNLKLKDANGEAIYPKMASSYCFLAPGKIELVYDSDSGDTTLMTRMLNPAQMITLHLIYSRVGTSDLFPFRIEIDTARKWSVDRFNAALEIPAGVYTIGQAKDMVGMKNVSVFGYILGGDVTNTTIKIAPPFTSKTNLIIAPNMSERNRNNCFAVELPSGKVRDDLNLVVHPELLGTPVILTGEIVESYFGYTGIKGTKSYKFMY